MRFFNLTPHAITIALESGASMTIPPSGIVARAETIEEPADSLLTPEGIVPVVSRRMGDASIPLPEGFDPTTDYIIVSSIVLEAARTNYRPDPSRFNLAMAARNRLLAPDTGSTALRNDKGQVVAVRRFVSL